MMKKKYFMICGPAASGKTTLIKGLNNKLLGSVIYKPAQAYIDLAKEYQIPIEDAFFNITKKEAYDYFCKMCNKQTITIGDQHLAIQPQKDSLLAFGALPLDYIEEPYTCAVDEKLFDLLSENEIEPFLFLLTASPELLFERACERNRKNGMLVRNKNLTDVVNEVNAEIYYFNELVQKLKLKNSMIDINRKTKEEVLDDVIQRIIE